MTTAELNKAIKKLWKEFQLDRSVDTTDWTRQNWEDHAKERERVKVEWLRLWNADREANYMKKEQLKAMLVINGIVRCKELHNMHHELDPKL